MNDNNNTNNNVDDEDQQPLFYGCEDKWAFSKRDRSQEVHLTNSNRMAHFHPNWSKGKALKLRLFLNCNSTLTFFRYGRNSRNTNIE